MNQKGFTIVEALVAIIIIVTVIFLVASLVSFKSDAPCEKFGNWSIKEVPVRCLDHFNVKEPQRGM